MMVELGGQGDGVIVRQGDRETGGQGDGKQEYGESCLCWK